MTTHNELDGWPGDEIGLPESGPGSMAPISRRFLALFIDWGIALLISTLLLGIWGVSGSDESVLMQLTTLIIFVLMHVILVGFLGVTIGKRLVRIQVVKLGNNGGRATTPGPVAALIRTVLLLALIPLIIIGPDARGLHDRLAGTVQVRM